MTTTTTTNTTHSNATAQIRTATPSDLPRLTDIYNQAIATLSCTCDTTPFTPEDRLAWFNDHQTDRYPLFVYEAEGQVLGYAYLSPYRSGREALRSIAEISYYIDFSAHRQGIATHLVHHTLHAAHHLGYKNLVAILLDCNTPSIALLESFGFEPWGTLPMVAELQNQRFSHLYYGLTL